MILNTIKTGLFFIAITSFSFANAQQKLETQKVQNKRAIKSFKALDTNSDETINLKELKANYKKDEFSEEEVKTKFLKMDTNKNGSISLDEFTLAFEMKKKSAQKTELKQIEKNKKATLKKD
ncbi:EF-hand domain-containing protein [uncultured Winogradskyella sp.]|uniref:EF-hand domain-containing protein n=1 Tax=uncultured Winogradskyella sp. TaxID=395353 RepID=UPI00262F6B30|nr:EF-hand domain-containing protein [uncultured Winogradskyella sp.]